MPLSAIDGKLDIYIANQHFWIVGISDKLEIHFPHFTALKSLSPALDAKNSQVSSKVIWLLSQLMTFDISIFVDGCMVARAGRHAKANFIGRRLGWPGIEVLPLAAFRVWMRTL